MSPIKYWQVDAFTDRPFGGNAAAICWLEQNVPDDWMQSIAAEMNLTVTAFVQRRGDDYGLRWFTPKVEVLLCGHATLATAQTLWSARIHPEAEPIRFHTQSGVLTCQQRNGVIEMDFPATPPEEVDPPPDLLAALQTAATYVGKSLFDYLVVVKDAETVRSLNPDLRKLRGFPTRGVIVTSHTDVPGFDFVSRFFAPSLGVDEDPVTGSAHCCLAPYWANVLGKREMTAFQASARGGVIHICVSGDRVSLGGQAVTVLHGELLAMP